MSLYRQAGRRSWAAVTVAVVAGAIVGAVGGYFGGRASKNEPSLSQQVADLRVAAQPLQLATQQVRIEYRGTVEDGKIVSPTEYHAAQATVERAVATLDELGPDLHAIDPSGTERVERELDSLRELVTSRAPQSAIDKQASATASALAATPAGAADSAAR